MKIYNIFVKNLKTVARNWLYFLILFILPFFLILTSAVLLNSNSLKNIRIGLVDNYGLYSNENLAKRFNEIMDVGRVRQYDALDGCLYDLVNYRLSVCCEISGEENGRIRIDVYIDNTRRIIELYAKQILMEKIYKEQSRFIEMGSEQIDSRIVVYTSYIDEATVELNKVDSELSEQENKLTYYYDKLKNLRANFDVVYQKIKNLEPQLNNIKNELRTHEAVFGSELNEIQIKINNLRSDINYLKNLLNSKLSGEELILANNYLRSIESSLNEIEFSLNRLKTNYPRNDIREVIESIEDLTLKIEDAKNTLDQLQADLDKAILRTREARAKISGFQNRLQEMKSEISNFGNETFTPTTMNFFKVYKIADNLVLVAFPFVVSIIITFSSLVLSNKFILSQVNKPSYLREIMTPSKDMSFLIADYLINMFFVSIQVIVLLMIGFFWFGLPFSILSSFLIIIFLASSVLVFLGMSFGYLIKSESLSVLITIFFVMFLLIFSDLLVPSVLSDPFIRFLINLSPFVIMQNSLYDLILINKGLGEIILPLFRLLILFVSCFFIAYLSRKASKDNVIQ